MVSSTRVPEHPSTRAPEYPSTRAPEHPSDADGGGGGGGDGGGDDGGVPTTLPAWQGQEGITHRDQISRSGNPSL